MNSITFFLSFIPFLALILLSLNLIFAPHNSYQEKSSTFECGFHSFLGQNRTQFNISFFVFGLLFLLFDMELVLLFPGALSLVIIHIYGLIMMLVFFVILTAGFAFELGKKALNIDSRQNKNKSKCEVEHNIYYSLKNRFMVNSITLIIKEYISKFNITNLITGFIILKYISYRIAFTLFIFRILESIFDVITVAPYIILLLIAMRVLCTPLKNILKLFITLMLNSIIIGFIITLVYYCFSIQIFSLSTLAAFTYLICDNMGEDSFAFIHYGSGSGDPSGAGPSGGDPSGGKPPGGGPENDPLASVRDSDNDNDNDKTNIFLKGLFFFISNSPFFIKLYVD